MSSLFGIFNLDGRPVAPQNLSRMRQAMSISRANASGNFCEGPIGLGGELPYDRSKQSSECIPLEDISGQLILISNVRLDNRRELFKSFNIHPTDQVTVTDSLLILKAYKKWGEDCPKYLLGDWAFALWDFVQQKLFIARDHYGVTALYYYHDSRRFFFSSSLKGLLALPELPAQLDPTILLKYTPSFKQDAGTAYKNIRSLTPSQAITITSNKLRVWHYWHPKEVPEIRFRSEQDYLDAFMEIYTESVACRLRSHRPVGSMLSGGLDSGSISVLAAHELSKTGKSLDAFSSVPTYDVTQTVPKNRCGDERPYIESTCASVDNINLHYVKAEKITPLMAIEQSLDIHNRPHSNANYGWLLTLLETAQQKNIGTILDGWGGNFTISWEGNRNKYLRTLLQTQKMGVFLQEIRAWRNIHKASIAGTIKNQIVKPFFLPSQLTQLSRKNFKQSFLHNGAYQSILKNYQSDLTQIDYEADNAINPGLYHFFRNGQTAMSFELASEFDIETRQPAMDKRVIEFCMGIPQHLHTQNGQERLLIRKAMHGMMPNNVLWCNHRGAQSADIVQKIRANKVEISNVLHELKSSAIVEHYMDLKYITILFKQVTQARLCPTLNTSASHMLKGLTLCLFLKRFEND